MPTTIEPVLQEFSERNVTDLRRLFNYGREQLRPGSYLRRQLLNVEDDDLRDGTEVAKEVKQILAQVLAVEQQINAFEDSTDLSLQSWSVDANYNVALRSDRDLSYGIRIKKDKLMSQLAGLICLPRFNHYSRKFNSG